MAEEPIGSTSSSAFKYRRVVSNDNTVRFGHHLIDIPRSKDRNSHAHARVEVHDRFDGTLCVFADHSDAADLAPVSVMSKPKAFRSPSSTPQSPAANHPGGEPS